MSSAPARLAIALASDDNYCRYLAVTVASILKNAAAEDVLDFYILDAGISAANKAKLETLKALRPCQITYLQVDAARFKDCPPLACGAHTNVVTYYRFLLGELLPQVDRLLYVDTDVVVLQSLAPLWKLDMTGLYAAVVEDKWEHIQTYKHQMGFAPEDKYFNAGVIFFNLEKWRQDGITQKLFENRQKLNEMKIFACGDQDALNFTFKGKIHFLPWSYNVQQSTFWQRDAEAQRKKHEVAIIHYNGPEKPDTPVCQHALRKDWWTYYALTPFYTPPGKNRRAPAWLKGLWVCHHRPDETLLRVLKLNLFKIERKGQTVVKLLGIPVWKGARQ